ncbi:MAG: hypothetical protein I8H76_06895 [Burkholderiales bacterium]|nr:hypothetical protein [Burkholderiales bacterium]MBH2016204.1 hypothetical protein [Burkholderiales bacterium]
MRANDPNLPYLRHIAEALGDLREQLVFVGGAVAGLLVTDPLADSVRATRDVDAVVNANRAMFYRIEQAVAQRGFARDVQSDVICRWIHKDSGVLFDLMPVQPEVLGFSNHWYPYAVETAESVELSAGLNIVDGREELTNEMANAPPDLRQAVASAFQKLLSDPDFANVLPGLVAEPERAVLVMQRLKAMSA